MKLPCYFYRRRWTQEVHFRAALMASTSSLGFYRRTSTVRNSSYQAFTRTSADIWGGFASIICGCSDLLSINTVVTSKKVALELPSTPFSQEILCFVNTAMGVRERLCKNGIILLWFSGQKRYLFILLPQNVWITKFAKPRNFYCACMREFTA